MNKVLQLIVASVASSLASMSATTISVVPDHQVVAPGTSFSVDLRISELGEGAAPSVSTFDIDLGFVAGVLSFMDGMFGTSLDIFGPGSVHSIILAPEPSIYPSCHSILPPT